MDKETKRRISSTVIGIVGIIVLLTGISFAAFSTNLAGVEVQGIKAGCLKVDMTDNGNLNITNAAPMTNESGLKGKPYTYTITNNCTVDASFTTTLNILNGSNIDNINKVKVALDKGSYLAPTMIKDLEETELVDSSETNVLKTYSLDSGYLKVGETKTFDLRTWIDYDVENITGSLESKIIILSTASQNLTIAYDKKTSGYSVIAKNTMLQNVSYKEISPSTNQLSGVVQINEGDGTKYYFRGNPNNYLTFAGKSFRVLSTNKDGSINIVLSNALDAGTYANINSVLDTWYNSNIKSQEKYVKTDQTFCEDSVNEEGEYLAKTRVDNYNPTSKCSNATRTKIGIPTVDDLMFAGAVKDVVNTSFYLNDSVSYFLSSYIDENNLYTYRATNSLAETSASGEWGIKPVITIASDVIISGNGTESSPFYISGKYSGSNAGKYNDEIKPEIVYARVNEKWSNTNKKIEISAKDNASGSGIAGYMIKTTSSVPSANAAGWEASTLLKYTSVNAYDNGTYYVFVKDNAGNVSGAKELKIEKVDKVAPTCTIRINPNENGSPNKVLSIISTETNIDINGYSWDHTESVEDAITVTANGVYTGHLTDLAGNKGSCSGTVLSAKPVVTTETAAETIVGSAELEEIIHPADSTLQIGATSDITEYRYRGANPNNYISFNNETWRIIGVFPTDDGTGRIENRLKIIVDANEMFGHVYDDTSSDYGRPALINTYLNNDFYNNLTTEAKSMVGDAKYYLGGCSITFTEVMYNYERKDYANSWIGKVALMYASDYGYAASYDCESNTPLDSYNDPLCVYDNWLYSDGRSGEYQAEWLLTQLSEDGTPSSDHLMIMNAGNVDIVDVMHLFGIRPVLYLTSDTKITGGDGTIDNPYTIEKIA